jgi:hypothetical protein
LCTMVKCTGAQELNCLTDGLAVLHDKRMRRVNHDMVAHARQFGPFNGNLSIIATGNQQAVDPVDGTIAGNDAHRIIYRTESVGCGIGIRAEFISRRAIDPLE